ncbi:hypothetical protein [Dokdonella soli]|uniref:hypothetical protein n=1 Tax=Dokdonella soli TaxID=529810 RepID=UPI0031E2D774
MNTIGFDIPTNPLNPTPQTITLAGQLPAINANGNLSSLTIDGYSQPGSVMNTNAPDQGGLTTKLMIEIAGNNVVEVFSYKCCTAPFITLTFQGLNLHDFTEGIVGQGFTIPPKAQLNVYGCFIGTNIGGTAVAEGPGSVGIDVSFDNAQIGGPQPWQRNLLSGNSEGVTGGAPDATIVIEGNLIGTDISGTRAITNSTTSSRGALALTATEPALRVGCTSVGPNPTCGTAASRNVISGNSGYGMVLARFFGGPYPVVDAQIKGNYIGTDWSGTKPLPNGNIADPYAECPFNCGGIQIHGGGSGSGPALIIGGFAPGEANLIANNNGPGIWANGADSYPPIAASFDNQGNAVHNNVVTDIAFFVTPTVFTGNGWIPNDPGDADTGANNQQNYPVIQSAHVSGGQLTVTYSVDSTTTNSTYPLRIDFYVDIDEGSGEFLVSDTYTSASAQQMRTVTLSLPADVQSPVGFVATATTADHYTSEFSPSYVFDRIFADRFEGH